METKRTAQLFVLLIISVCLHLTAGHQTFIVAKGKPANMSTKQASAVDPLQGMDGNTVGNYLAGVQCVHTATSDPLPWWMVDMQLTYLISGARVWNRIDYGPERFTQISIGVTSNPSVWTTFSTGLLDLCAYWPGVPTAADNPINFTCSRPIAGRYLAVYKDITGLSANNSHLQFCEIDIIAITKQPPYSMTVTQPSFSPTSTSLLVDAPLKMRSDIECVIQCSVLPDCLYALFRAASLDCWLFGSFTIPDSFVSVFNSSGVRFLAVYG